MNELALFAGVGGGLLGTKYYLGWRTICYVEKNPYAVKVLKARIKDGYLDDAPIWDDCNTFDGHPWAGLVDVVSAGFPCQPFSVAGKGAAENDPRNGWPATIRIIREVRSKIVWLENVPGLISKPYFRRILGDLAEAGYDIEWDCVSAAEVGAPHKRERLWILAYTQGKQINLQQQPREESLQSSRNGATQFMADSDDRLSSGENKEIFSGRNLSEHDGKTFSHSQRIGRKGKREIRNFEGPTGLRSRTRSNEIQVISQKGSWRFWQVEPKLGRVADGVASALDRFGAIEKGLFQ